MSRLRFICPHCRRIVPAGERCPCRPKPKRRPTSGDRTRAEREPWRKRYGEAEYQRNRQEALDLSKGRCVDCGVQIAMRREGRWMMVGGGEVDHETPLCDGGGHEVRRLRPRCKRCHSKVEAARRKQRKK